MNSIFQNIKDITLETAKRNNLLLIDFVIRGTDRDPVIEVFVDGEENITAEKCVELSREINNQIEEKEILKSSYRLDVSSPGVDRPLKFLKQYPKHLNRNFEIEYKSGDTVKNLKGRLISIEEDVLTFFSGNEIKLKYKDIVKAKVLVSFN